LGGLHTSVYHRGLSPDLARQVAEELTEKDAVRAHARDELGIDIDEMSDPLQVSCFGLREGYCCAYLSLFTHWQAKQHLLKSTEFVAFC